MNSLNNLNIVICVRDHLVRRNEHCSGVGFNRLGFKNETLKQAEVTSE